MGTTVGSTSRPGLRLHVYSTMIMETEALIKRRVGRGGYGYNYSSLRYSVSKDGMTTVSNFYRLDEADSFAGRTRTGL
jgi:hypothetical protein